MQKVLLRFWSYWRSLLCSQTLPGEAVRAAFGFFVLVFFGGMRLSQTAQQINAVWPTDRPPARSQERGVGRPSRSVCLSLLRKEQGREGDQRTMGRSRTALDAPGPLSSHSLSLRRCGLDQYQWMQTVDALATEHPLTPNTNARAFMPSSTWTGLADLTRVLFLRRFLTLSMGSFSTFEHRYK